MLLISRTRLLRVSTVLLVTGTLAFTGCSSDDGDTSSGAAGSGGSARAGSGGDAGSAQGGQAGNAGSAQGGQAGNAGSAQGGQAGNAGSAQGGQAGNAGGAQGGQAGSAGAAGSSSCPTMNVVTLLDGFSIDATEVSRCQYKAWLDTLPSTGVQGGECSWNTSFTPSCSWPGSDQLPVACVDWCDAVAYCSAQGKRLCGAVDGGSADFYGFNDPDESEWFNACWNGENADSPPCNAKALGTGATVAVGSITACTTKAAGYTGIYDLIGNVWEWEDSCEGSSSKLDQCHIRGGGFDSDGTEADCSRGEEIRRDTHRNDIGFRCCSK